MDSLKNRASKAFFWDLVGRFANQGVGFIISIFLSRLLEPSDFGLLAMINVVILVSFACLDSGLTRGLIQRKELRDAHYGSAFFFNIFLACFFTCTLFLCSKIIAEFYDKPILEDVAKVMSFLFVLSSIGNVIRAKLRRELNFRVISKSTVGGSIIGGVVGVVMAFYGFGVWSLVAQSMFSVFISNILLFYSVSWRPKLIFEMQALKELWSFSFKPFLIDLTDLIYSQMDSLMIGKFFDSKTLGFYYRAKSLQNLIYSYVGSSIGNITLPALSQVQTEDYRFNAIFFKLFHVLCFFSFLSLGVLYLGAESIIIILFSKKWLLSVDYFKILSLASFTYPIGLVLSNALLSKGNSSQFFKLGLYKKIFQFIPFLLLPFWGMKLFLYGVTISSFICFVLTVLYVIKLIPQHSNFIWIELLKYCASTFFLLLLMSQLNSVLSIENVWLNLLINIFLFSLLFVFLSQCLRLAGWTLVKLEVMNILSKILKR